jgi:clan AA aspartic protease
MGLIRGVFILSNPSKPELASVEVSALADTGAVHLCIPEHLAIQLNLAELEQREVVLADGRRRTVPYVGPVELRFKNRRCFTGAMVLGNEVLLGAIPMEDMDLVLRPQLQSVDVNPESPNIPVSLAKSTGDG